MESEPGRFDVDLVLQDARAASSGAGGRSRAAWSSDSTAGPSQVPGSA
ncbi:hypothetical protein ABT299_38605 [Spirillospora sp. NPDC000708]